MHPRYFAVGVPSINLGSCTTKLIRRRFVLGILTLVAIAASTAQAITIYAIDINNKLIRFDSATPGTLISSVPITGTVASEQITAIDFRPTTEQLYGLGSNNR